jgi:hypothetical protein
VLRALSGQIKSTNIVVLTEEEKMTLEQERGWQFEDRSHIVKG